MTEVTITRTSDSVQIYAKGHADYAPHGSDIVCAAVSAILQSLSGYAKQSKHLKYCSCSSGEMTIVIKKNKNLLSAINMSIYGLKEIANQYSENLYVAVI